MKRVYLLGITVLLLGQIALADSTFVSGTVSGRWVEAHSPYIVEGDIRVQPHDTLVIEPGVTVYFTGPYFLQMDSAASLHAVGAEGDSVVFTGRTDVDSLRWAGIDCNYSADTLRFEYCVIENATGQENKAAVSARESAVKIEHCSFRWNVGRSTRDVHGGALLVSVHWSLDREATIRDCEFLENRANHGGAVALHNVSGVMERCVFRDNIASSGGALYGLTPPMHIIDCEFYANMAQGSPTFSRGGAIWYEGNLGQVINCTFENNYAQTLGGAIADPWSGASYPDTTRYEGVLFKENSSDSLGGALAIGGRKWIRKCFFDSNSAEEGGAISYTTDGLLSITQSSFVNNTATVMGSVIKTYYPPSGNLRFVNCVVAFNFGSPAFNRPDCQSNYFRNNAFWANDPAVFSVDGCSSRHGVHYVNSNGDSCDGDYQLYLDPLFVDAANNDFNLLENSPLIDAGVAGSLYNTVNDPDNTTPDIGAFYFDQTSASEELPELPSSITLAQNYPNPFNAETTIEFEVPMETHATLELFDIMGRHVRTLFDDVSSGRSSVHVSMNGLASGIYIYRLNAGGYALSHKMLLIR